MSLVVDGLLIEAPGLVTRSWHDDPRLRLKLPEDGRRRAAKWVRSIILHTTMGIAPTVYPGFGKGGGALDTALWWSSPQSGAAGAHLVVDWDGVVYCLADLQREVAYHATTINEVSIGIELRQGHGKDGALYAGQLQACAALVDVIAQHFELPRQLHWPYLHGQVPRLASGGADCVGIFGHRDQTSKKPAGDPGDPIYTLLMSLGYEPFDYAHDEDLFAWKERQRKMNALGAGLRVDGICGPMTYRAWSRLKARVSDGYQVRL